MPKIATPLSPLAVGRLKSPGLYSVGGAAGLQLRISDTGARYWLLRILIAGKRTDIGLGAYPEIGLARAREIASEMRAVVREGGDPLADRRQRKAELIEARAKLLTFNEAVRRYLANKTAEFKNAKHAAQWASTLQTYASPVIGRVHVGDIQITHILEVLEPIWTTKTETASRLRGRIEAVLAWATVGGYRRGDNPARWKGNLDAVLAKPSKLATVRHQPALPYSRIPAFMAALHEKSGVTVQALEFAILTAARSGEVRGATWDEVDMKAARWTIPAARMKAEKEHVVALSPAALALLQALSRTGDLIFPAPRGGQLSDAALSKAVKDMHEASVRTGGDGWLDPQQKRVATAHGFRSTFRDWAGETTSFPREVIEHAMAHQLKDKAEAAYARGSQFEKRRKLMAAWSSYCTPAGS